MKRLISLLLTLVMVLAMLPASVGAAEDSAVLDACGPAGFKDTERIGYTQAVAVTAGVGLFAGKSDGRFDPSGKVTRAQMSTVVVKMLKGGDFNADSYKGEANPFPDTAAFEGGWAEGYINACRQLGVVSGYPDGTFHPEKEVTAAEALTMVINALKVDAGAGEWPTTVMNKASEMKLYDELKTAPAADTVLDREELAVIVSAGVQYKPAAGESLLSSVFGVKKINTEHKYDQQTKLCTVCRTAMPGVLTRADLEKAVVEVAFDYYLKGAKLQYDSQELGMFNRDYGTQYRVTENVAPEYGTEDTTIYSVCADWIYQVYLEAIGHRLLNKEYAFQTVTESLWRQAENQADGPMRAVSPDPVTDKDIDYCLMRWKRDSYSLIKGEKHFGLDTSPYFANFGDYHLTFSNGYYATTPEEQDMADDAVQAYLNDWEKNLRPGDVFVVGGHALLYVGSGYVLDCNSVEGGKYNLTSGKEIAEPRGAVFRMNTVPYYFTTGEYQYYLDKTGAPYCVLFRPTIGLVTDDGDGNLANDLVTDPNFTIPSKTLSREQFPGMEIDRTVDITPYGTAYPGEELTYTVKITNKSNEANYVKHHTYYGAPSPATDYTGLTVTETVPDGTKFVSATGDFVRSDDLLSWTLDIPAGQTAEVSYTVEVDAAMGSTIKNDGGFVAEIPSNCIENTVGGAKLSDGALAVLKQIADTEPEQWREKFNISRHTCDLDFVERIYQKMGIDLELPTVQQMAADVFTWKSEYFKSLHYRADDLGEQNVYMLKDEVTAEYQSARDMLIDGYWGGYRFFTGYDKRGTTITEFRLKYLEPGDIVVYVTEQVNGVPAAATVMLYAGKDSKGEDVLFAINSKHVLKVYHGDEVEEQLWKAYMTANSLYFAMRPAQGVEDLNAAVFDPAKEPVYDAAEPEGETRPTEIGTTTLDAVKLANLQAMAPGDAFGQRFKFVIDVYKKIGIAGLGSLIKNEENKAVTTADAMLKLLFTRTDNTDSETDRTYTLNAEKKLTVQNLLIDGYYGGRWIKDNTTGQLPSVSGLQPGDVLILAKRHISLKNNNWNTTEINAVYQGDGKFLVADYCWAARPTGAYGPVPNGYKYGTLDFSGEIPTGKFCVNSTSTALGDVWRTVNDLNGGDGTHGYVKVDSYEQFLTRDPFTGEEWDFFFALRPSQGVYDVNDLDYAPAT